MSIVYSSSLDKLTECNTSFDKGVLKVCYVGRNRNNSFISKETFERCIESIYNCPIVCRYDRDADEIGSHDMELVSDNDGRMKLVNITTPVGVIPESAKYWWAECEEDDGSIHEYLCVDALLWKRQEAYQKIKENGITDESMEITIKEGGMKDGVYVIDRFEFTAFCLLGTAEPCYESASLMMFSQNEFKAQLDEMMREFKENFSLVQSSQEVVIPKQNYSEGGEGTLDEKMTLMAQYGLSEDMIDFNLEDFTVEELQEKFEALKANGDPLADEPHGDEPEENFALAEQFKEELMSALSEQKIETCFGEMCRYWYMDYDSEASEVYCYDQEDWRLYGFSYSMNGDNVIVDFESKKRKKIAIVDFDEGEQRSVFAEVYSAIVAQHGENENRWNERYQEASNAIAEMENELAELRQYKADIEKAAVAQERNEILDQFADLAGIDAFEQIRENCEQYSVEELEEKCFAIRGRNQTAKFSVTETKPPKLLVEKGDPVEAEPYGGVFAKFNIR